MATTASLEVKEAEQNDDKQKTETSTDQPIEEAEASTKLAETTVKQEETTESATVNPEDEQTTGKGPETEIEQQVTETSQPDEEPVLETTEITEIAELDQEVKDLQKQMEELEIEVLELEHQAKEVEDEPADPQEQVPIRVEQALEAQVPDQEIESVTEIDELEASPTELVPEIVEPPPQKPEEAVPVLDSSPVSEISFEAEEFTTSPSASDVITEPEPKAMDFEVTKSEEIQTEMAMEISTEPPFLSLQKLFQDQFSEQPSTSESPKRRRKVTGSGYFQDQDIKTPPDVTIGNSLRVSEPSEPVLHQNILVDDTSLYDPMDETVDESWGRKEAVTEHSSKVPEQVNVQASFTVAEDWTPPESESGIIEVNNHVDLWFYACRSIIRFFVSTNHGRSLLY